MVFRKKISRGPSHIAPKPKPATTKPLTIPFLDGWNHFIAAARGQAYTKPMPLPTSSEKMTINIVKPGKEYGQGIGYLDDGTMIVVENGADYIGRTMEVTVTTTLQTNAGRMIFTRIIQE